MWRWWITLGVGVSALTAGICVLVSVRTLPPAFSDVRSGSALASPSAVAASEPPARRPSADPASIPSTPTVSSEPFRPTSVVLSAFGVTAPVDTALSTAGVLQPPDDPGRVGWWTASALVGAAGGPTVIVGHVDGPAGPGALYRLVHTHAGDHITVAGSNGQRATYTVSSLQYHDKGSSLPSTLFRGGPPRLVIVSCGGAFDRADSSYRDNVIVQATPDR